MNRIPKHKMIYLEIIDIFCIGSIFVVIGYVIRLFGGEEVTLCESTSGVDCCYCFL